MLNDIKHIAIIMDGNRRWAEKNKLKLLFGHRKGAESLEEVLRHCGEAGLKILTVYAFSTENWKREKSQVDDLMSLMAEYLVSKSDELMDNNVIFRTIGNTDNFPEKVQKGLKDLIERTNDNKGIVFNVALSYGGRDEIVRATNKAVSAGKEIDEDEFSSFLDTKGLDDPDILIRTGGNRRLSNFLLWQLSYSEIFFTETLWPDFTAKELERIVEEYRGAQKNYGK